MREQKLSPGAAAKLLDGFTAYTIERREERYQSPGQIPWRERRNNWMEHILTCAAGMEGLAPGTMVRQWKRSLETAAGNQAVEVSSTSVQRETVCTLGQYVRALAEAEGDHRLQILEVRDLLEDMFLDRLWGGRDEGLFSTLERANQSLIKITARQPIRFSHVLLGPETGPCEAGFLPGCIAAPEQLRETEFFQCFCEQHPEKSSWPALGVTYACCGGRFTRDANELDLDIIRDAGERFLYVHGVLNLDLGHQMVVQTQPDMDMTITM